MQVQDKVIIYLPAEATHAPDWVWQDKIYQGETEKLAQVAKGKEVIALVAAEAVLLTTVAMPKMGRSRLLQALPFALEDQLAADLDQLHFALGRADAAGLWSCAIVAKEKMVQWQAQLQAWQVEADIFLPMVLALPYEEGRPSVCMIDQMAYVRTGEAQGFACDITNLPILVPEEKAYQTWPFKEILEKPAINLLQGAFKSKKSRLPDIQKTYKAAGILAIAFAVLLLLSPLISYLILMGRLAPIQHQIDAIYYKHFPQATQVVAPKQRMEDKLKQLAAHQDDSKILVLFQYLGQGMQNTPQITLKRLDFQQSRLTVDVSALSPDAVDGLTAFLTRQGLNVKSQNAQFNEGKKFNATLVVE